MTSFYDAECTESSFLLPEDESRHAIKSLRLRIGEKFNVLNGNGLVIHAEMTGINSGLVEYQILSAKRYERKSPALSIALSPLKQVDRFENFVEKATELGVQKIIPIICDRSEKIKIREDRLNRIIISAMKQSGNAFIPRLESLINFKDLIAENRPENGYIAHCEKSQKIELKNMNFDKDALILIGPEGDFTESEITDALHQGYQALSLGDLTLRAETAAIAVSTYFQLSI